MGDILFGIRGGAAFAADYHRIVRPRLDALDALRKRTLLQIVAIWGGLLPLLLLLVVGLGWLFHFMVGWFALLAGAGGLYWLAGRQARLYRGAIRNVVMPPVCAFIGGLEFSTDPEIAIDPAPFSKLRLLPPYESIRAEYLLWGHYLGRRFRFAEATLRTDGPERVFHRALIAIELGQPLAGRVLIGAPQEGVADWIAGWTASWRGLARIAFDDAVFESLFHVYAEVPATAQSLLTAAARRGLIEIRRERRGRAFALGFDGEKLLIALEDVPLLSTSVLLTSAQRLESHVERLLRKVTIPHRLIDYLNGGNPGPL